MEYPLAVAGAERHSYCGLMALGIRFGPHFDICRAAEGRHVGARPGLGEGVTHKEYHDRGGLSGIHSPSIHRCA